MNRRMMSGNRSIIVMALLIATAIATTACGRTESAGDADEPYVKVVNVEVETLRPATFSATVRITAEAEPETDITLSAEESGILEAFVAKKGTRVRRGQAIARIDDDVLAAQVDEARAGAEIAASRHEAQREARAGAEIAASRHEAQRRLWEDEGIGSEIVFLQAKADAESAMARHVQLQARLDRTVVRSPVAGTFDSELVDAGEIVQPGTPVARIVDGSGLRITGGVAERFAPQVSVGGDANISFDILPGQVFEGQIDFVGTAVDRQSRTFPIEIVMDNPDGAVKPYMIANVRVLLRRVDDAIVVSREVLIRTEDGFLALVVESQDGNDIAVPRTLVLGSSDENSVVVMSGLEAGDRLVVRGQQLVDPGDRVRIVGGAE